ncbi:MAG: RNA polymerase sigma factor [Candidatus Paceibacterota bacterium]
MTTKENIRLQILLTTAHGSYNRGLNAHAFFKVNDHAMCDDLVQSTFLKTWIYLVKGGKIDTMKAFLYHILNNLIVDQYRKHKTDSLDALIENGYEPAVDDTSRLFNIMDGKVAALLIKSLPETYQKVMRMKYMQDLSLKEMSLITGQSKNTMAVKAHRGLAKLKVLYAHA